MHTHDRPAPPAQSKNPMPAAGNPAGMSLSMHDGVEVWCDCCSCEAEPYWVETLDEGRGDSDSAGGTELST